MMLRIFILPLLLLISACDGTSSTGKLSEGERSVAVGQFRLSGSAESGQYALHLLKLNRLVRDELARAEGWSVLESDRVEEITTEHLLGAVASEDGSLPAGITLPKARYLLVVEMDGFDVRMDTAPVVRKDGIRRIAAKVANRRRMAYSRISLRLVDVETRQWLVNRVIEFQEPMPDEAGAETQVNRVLARMAETIVDDTLLSVAGPPTVASVNADGTVILNRGEDHGVRLGQRLSLERPAETVADQESKRELVTSNKLIGGLEVIQVAGDYAIARYTGVEPAKVGDRAVFFVTQKNGDEYRIRPVRVAVGGFVLDKAAEYSLPRGSLIGELEAGLLHRLHRDSGLKVVEQDGAHIKRLLAQQMLTDLGKGREPGLPLGTLSGVDYLLFGQIHAIELVEASDLKIAAIGQTVAGGVPASGRIRAHLYLEDVNTGEHILSEEIPFQVKLTKGKVTDPWAELFSSFADEAHRRFLLGLRPLRVEFVSFEDITLNHGRAAGLAEGTQLIVYTTGEGRRDPYTGALMEGIGARDVARLEVVDFSPQGWARAKLIEGSRPTEGMGVRMVRDWKPTSAQAFSGAGADTQASITSAEQAHQTHKGPLRVAVGAFGITDAVRQVLGSERDQLLAEMDDALVYSLSRDAGFRVANQDPEHVKRLIDQNQLKHGPEAAIPAGVLEGVDFLIYGRLLSASAEKGTSRYISAVGESVKKPGKVRIKASLYLEDMRSGDYILHERVDLDEPWRGDEAVRSAWSRLFDRFVTSGMSKALLSMRPLRVDWVSNGAIGINHGRSAGLKSGDRLIAYTEGETRQDRFTGATRSGIGARRVGEFEITGFAPDGWAEARLIDGDEPETGARLRLAQVQSGTVDSKPAGPTLNW